MHSMLAPVRAGMGVALVPEAAANLRFDGVLYRPVATSPTTPVRRLFVFRKDNDNPILQAFTALQQDRA